MLLVRSLVSGVDGGIRGRAASSATAALRSKGSILLEVRSNSSFRFTTRLLEFLIGVCESCLTSRK